MNTSPSDNRSNLYLSKLRLAASLMLGVYSAALIKVMVFKDMPTFRIGSLMLNFSGTDGGHPANFIPYRTILLYLHSDNLIIGGSNIVGNIALLIPVGLLIPVVIRHLTWKKAVTIAVCASLAIELSQVALRIGIFDIDDVILNALGVMTGYRIFMILARWVRSKSYLYIVIAALTLVAAVSAACYVLYPKGAQTMRPGGIILQ
jgi:glycopeptide antibiotics resistance protein